MKTTKTKKAEDYLDLVLEGAVYLVETKGTKITKTQLNGKDVLGCLIAVITRGLEDYATQVPNAKKPPRNRRTPQKQRRTHKRQEEGAE